MHSKCTPPRNLSKRIRSVRLSCLREFLCYRGFGSFLDPEEMNGTVAFEGGPVRVQMPTIATILDYFSPWADIEKESRFRWLQIASYYRILLMEIRGHQLHFVNDITERSCKQSLCYAPK
jgi:hypothetical protein